MSFGSGRRTRSFLALRSEDAAEHTSRTWSIAATRSASDGSRSGAGQSVRCTDRSRVRPRQIISVISGSSGAASLVVTSNTVCSVSMASASSAQNRERDRRTYQLVNASVN
ncbi:Uncharacterised protein [Mycobacterium tuberculosis]|uniref:Uncharacterized protein n=1 Tax=Mycobacterium tuberculosis TaxID=1773 RepID=A0A655EXI9_MYCTX|nr:Uncharacterised protein [Mycobacterium tuberculosis]CFE55389.1 Uncharacterised protein [Mycobacterium tuberculosis]CKT04803.1 Uncharacterised protein [Mycobacterium tuberculosis]CNT91191.1 Uncharacterised protein [Mycobacterium tuberculosis]CNU64201.1 Uncharacterised protein [Mycobacterium tuberculosis]